MTSTSTEMMGIMAIVCFASAVPPAVSGAVGLVFAALYAYGKFRGVE